MKHTMFAQMLIPIVKYINQWALKDKHKLLVDFCISYTTDIWQ